MIDRIAPHSNSRISQNAMNLYMVITIYINV